MGYLNFPVHVAFLKETLFWIIAFESRPTGCICFAASQSKVQMKRHGLAKRRNSYCSLWQPLLSVLQLRGLKGFCVVVCILLCVFFLPLLWVVFRSLSAAPGELIPRLSPEDFGAGGVWRVSFFLWMPCPLTHDSCLRHLDDNILEMWTEIDSVIHTNRAMLCFYLKTVGF